MKKDLVDIIVRIVFLIISIVLIYWMVQILLGGSPALSQVNAMFIVGIITILFTMMKSYSDINREVGEIKIGIKEGFQRVREDIKRLENIIREK